MNSVSYLFWKIRLVLTPMVIAGGLLAMILMLGTLLTFDRGSFARHTTRSAQTRNAFQYCETALTSFYAANEQFPRAVAWEPSAGYSLSNQTVLPDTGFEEYRMDFHTDGVVPFRYATDGKCWVLVGAGPDGKWTFDISTWTPEMTVESAPVKAAQFDEENGRWSRGDIFLFGTAPK